MDLSRGPRMQQGHISSLSTDLGSNMSAAALQPVFDALWNLQLSNYAASKDLEG